MNNRLDEHEIEALIQGYLESSLNEKESARLNSLLRQNPEKVDLILNGLRDDVLIRTVVAELMVVSPGKSSAHAAQRAESIPWIQSILGLLRRNAWTTTTVGVTTFAALLVFLWLWCFGPAVGTPVLAEVQGQGISLERSSQSIAPTPGTSLRAGDILRTTDGTTAVIRFAPEETRVTLLPGTEFSLTALSRGKVFDLVYGKVEASVARQRPFRPMILQTPHAEARVIGTQFTLSVNSNATQLDVIEGKVRFTRKSDLGAVKVTTGHYALAGADCELRSLPLTGSITHQWWCGVAGSNINALLDNSRFPSHPDGSDLARALELEPVQTNQFGVRFCGYLHPPITGNYEFWLTGATKGQLLMSPNDDPMRKAPIAQIGYGLPKSFDLPRFQGPSNRTPPVRLVAGRIYYIEAIVLIEHGEGHLSVAWKPPGGDRELLTGQFLSPFKP